MENMRDLLAGEVVGAQLSPYWYNSIPAYVPDPPSDFPRVWFRNYADVVKEASPLKHT